MKTPALAQDTRSAVAQSQQLRECSRKSRAEAHLIIEQARNAVSTSRTNREVLDSTKANCWFVRPRPYDATICRSVCFCKVLKAIIPDF